MFFKNKNVLVAGGTGLIGRYLSKLLDEQGASVRIASIDDRSRVPSQIKDFQQVDLTEFENCRTVCQDMDYVFNLLCVKGSPQTVKEHPWTMMLPMTLFNTYLFDAIVKQKIKGFLYTSSIGVYYPAPVYHEDDTEKTPAPRVDYAGRTKLYGEWCAEAIIKEFGSNITIVRPANTYGPYDDFDSEKSMVVPSLIKKMLTQDTIVDIGDGAPVRDFIHAEDVARGMLLVTEKSPGRPVNLGSGKGVTIRSLLETILSFVDKKPEIVWDDNRFKGDEVRLMDISRARSLGFEPRISLEQGIKETMEWYKTKIAPKE